MHKTLIRIALTGMLSLELAAAEVHAEEGTVDMTINVEADCSAPSINQTLVLPFDPKSSLINQPLAAAPVTVTMTCFGEPTINHVEFDDGLHRGGVLNAAPHVRYMRRQGSDGASQDSFLGYLLWAAPGSSNTSSSIAASGTPVSNVSDVDGSNRLTLTADQTDFQITGKVHEGSQRTRAFGNPSQTASGARVPAGAYSDTVTVRIDYN
jgi:spore coat protein U-like protein